jgi:hypothetical protein
MDTRSPVGVIIHYPKGLKIVLVRGLVLVVVLVLEFRPKG